MFIKINKLNFNGLKNNPLNILIIGNPHCINKKKLIKKILDNSGIKYGIAFDDKYDNRKITYYDILLDDFVSRSYEENTFKKFILKQRRSVRIDGSSDENFAGLFVNNLPINLGMLDDKKYKSVLKNNRRFNLLILQVHDYPIEIYPTLRTYFDYIFIMKGHSFECRKRIWENYVGILENFEMFQSIFSELTKGGDMCMVVHNRCLSNKIEDNVFWCKF